MYLDYLVDVPDEKGKITFREKGNAKYVYYVNITVQMYPCSEGTDTGSPALRYRESGTGIPHFATCEFTRLMPDPTRILHAWICNSPGLSG